MEKAKETAKAPEAVKRKAEDVDDQKDEAKKKSRIDVRNDEWVKAWDKGSIGFHEGEPNA